MKKVVVYALLMITAGFTFSQSEYKLALAAKHGVIVKNLIGAFNAKFPGRQGITKIAIERKTNNGSYEKIGYFKVSDNYNTALFDYRKNSKYALDMIMVNAENFDNCYEIYDRTHSYDSCIRYIMEPALAVSLGFYYYDENVREGNSYQYKITGYNESGTAVTTMLSEKIDYPNKYKYPAPKVYKSNANNTNVNISYYILTNSRKPRYFKVYRKQTYLGEWEQIYPNYNFESGKGDTFIMKFLDQRTSENSIYFYRIQTMDAYGNEGLESDTVSVLTFGAKDLPLPEQFRTSYDHIAKNVMLEWKIVNPYLISGIEIYRSQHYDTGYQVIGRTGPWDTFFYDNSAEPMTPYYYYFKVYDPAGRASVISAKTHSLMEDKTTPFPPMIERISEEKNGVKLRIFTPEDHLNGVSIYRSNGSDTIDIVQISELIPLVNNYAEFVDTSAKNNAYGYSYFVKAVNTSHIYSEYSRASFITLQSKKPARYITTQMLSANEQNGNVMLTWENLRNQDEAIIGFNVYRKTGSTGDFKKLNSEPLSAIDNLYLDSTQYNTNDLFYRVIPVYSNGKEGLHGNTVEINVGLELSAPLNAAVSRDKEGYKITWQSVTTNVAGINIYKSEDEGAFTKVATLGSTETFYIDKAVKSGSFTRYYLSSTDSSGNESLPGKTVFIR